MKNILITGGGGFLGRNLIDFLIKYQNVNKIIVLDNFITSEKRTFIKFQQQFEKNVLLYSYDITNSELVNFLIKDLKDQGINTLDEIYHLASLASPPFYKKYPIETLDVGYIGTKNMLELAKLYDSKILFASTSEVYGDAQISPQHENYYGNVNSFGARSCYDESKRVAEALCYTYLTMYGVDVKVVRIFNTYGPHMLLNDGRIITECIKHLMNKTTLTIYGDGNQTRSCCFAKDTVSMMTKLMGSYFNEPVNVGNNEERTINDTVKLVNKVWNKMYGLNDTLDIQYVELTQNDPLQRKPCLQLNKQVLGINNYTSFEDGILQTIEYFKNHDSHK